MNRHTNLDNEISKYGRGIDWHIIFMALVATFILAKLVELLFINPNI